MSTESKLDPQVPIKPWWQQHGETIRIFVIALAIALFLRTFIVEPRFIPSGSMEPTLQVGDRILVDKISQRWQEPQRGDILIFYPPKSPAIEDNTKAYIKRLIGIEGDRDRHMSRNDHRIAHGASKRASADGNDLKMMAVEMHGMHHASWIHERHLDPLAVA